MGLITKPKTYIDNENVTYTDLNADFDNVYNEVNGSLDDANVDSAAAIQESKFLFSTSSGHTHNGTDSRLDTTSLLKSKIKTATRDMTAASGDVAYTGIGFTPTAIISLANIPGASGAAWGMVDSAKTSSEIQASGGNFYEDNSFLIQILTSSDNYQVAVLKSYDADGFTLTWTKAGSPTGTLSLNLLCFR